MNSEQKKFLDENGLKILWNQISMHDYPNNAALTSVINAIDANKADKADIPRIDTTLSAAGAAADAKAVGEAIENIELTPGPKGDSGVYVGASAPTDESVNVWINPNGEAADSPTGGNSYVLPVATQNILGGVKPVAKSDDMTQSVGVDAAGGLWTAAGGEWRLAKTLTIEETVTQISITDDDDGKPLNFRECCIEWYNPNAEETSGAYIRFNNGALLLSGFGTVGKPNETYYGLWFIRRLGEKVYADNVIYNNGTHYGNSVVRMPRLYDIGNINSILFSTDGRKAIGVGATMKLYVKE